MVYSASGYFWPIHLSFMFTWLKYDNCVIFPVVKVHHHLEILQFYLNYIVVSKSKHSLGFSTGVQLL